MSVRKRKWASADGIEKSAWVCDFKDLRGRRRLKTFPLKKQADRFATKTRSDLLDAYLKTNGPAATGIAPDRGSKHLEGEMKVNTQTNTTSAPGDATASKSPPTVSDLEDPIMDALRMSSIAVSLAERSVGGKPLEKRGTGGLYHLTYDQRENIMFAIVETERMVSAIKARWEAIQ